MMGVDGYDRKKKIVFVTVGTTSFDALIKAIDTHEVREELLRKGYTDLLIQMGRGSYVPSKMRTGLDRYRCNGVHMLVCDDVPRGLMVSTLVGQTSYLCHCRLGHPYHQLLQQALPWARVESFNCESCQLGSPNIFKQFLGEDGSLSVDYFTFSPSIAEYLRSASLIISHAGSGSIFETLRLGKPLIVVVNEDLMDNHQTELAEELADRKHLFCARPLSLHHTIQNMDLGSLLLYQPGDAVPVARLMNKFLGFPVD